MVSGSLDSTIRVCDVESALFPKYEKKHDPVFALKSSGLESGFLWGCQGELLLWVLSDYRAYLELPTCNLLISERRVVIATGETLHCADNWTACWPGGRRLV